MGYYAVRGMMPSRQSPHKPEFEIKPYLSRIQVNLFL